MASREQSEATTPELHPLHHFDKEKARLSHGEGGKQKKKRNQLFNPKRKQQEEEVRLSGRTSKKKKNQNQAGGEDVRRNWLQLGGGASRCSTLKQTVIIKYVALGADGPIRNGEEGRHVQPAGGREQIFWHINVSVNNLVRAR